MIKLSSLLIEQVTNPYRKLFTYLDKKLIMIMCLIY